MQPLYRFSLRIFAGCKKDVSDVLCGVSKRYIKGRIPLIVVTTMDLSDTLITSQVLDFLDDLEDIPRTPIRYCTLRSLTAVESIGTELDAFAVPLISRGSIWSSVDSVSSVGGGSSRGAPGAPTGWYRATSVSGSYLSDLGAYSGSSRASSVGSYSIGGANNMHDGVDEEYFNYSPSSVQYEASTTLMSPSHKCDYTSKPPITQELIRKRSSSSRSTPYSTYPLTPKSPKETFKSFDNSSFTVQENSLFFVIKSYSILDVNGSLLNNIWTSTDLGNKRLSKAFQAAKQVQGKIYLFFLVNASGKFCGVAEMTADIDFTKSSNIWAEQTRWKGIFPVKWLYVKDVPNRYFNNLRVPSNANKVVSNSRDTQEIPYKVGVSMLKIIGSFK